MLPSDPGPYGDQGQNLRMLPLYEENLSPMGPSETHRKDGLWKT